MLSNLEGSETHQNAAQRFINRPSVVPDAAAVYLLAPTALRDNSSGACRGGHRIIGCIFFALYTGFGVWLARYPGAAGSSQTQGAFCFSHRRYRMIFKIHRYPFCTCIAM
jgi:hypothetical protein